MAAPWCAQQRASWRSTITPSYTYTALRFHNLRLCILTHHTLRQQLALVYKWRIPGNTEGNLYT